jgi:hypothetical protein
METVIKNRRTYIQPYPSWVWNDVSNEWEAPTPCLECDAENWFEWNENNLSWERLYATGSI